MRKKSKEKTKKPRSIKKLLLILLPILLLIGTGAGLVLTGKVTLPFMKGKPVAKGPAAPTAKPPVPKKAPKVVATRPTAPTVTIKTKPVAVPDPAKGFRKVAAVWDGMEVDALGKIVANWKDAELAPVLLKMDADKVAELMAAMDPKRASLLAKAIQREASRPVAKL